MAPPKKTKTKTTKKKSVADEPRDPAEAEAHRVFSAWAPEDFFSDRATHVYFHNDLVDGDTVDKLRADVHAANAGTVTASGALVSPKPIVVHVHSPGGYVDPGLRLMSIFRECRVPVCTLIEGMSMSASTFLTVLAPYRVMTSHATTLIHEYAGGVWGKSQDLVAAVTHGEKQFANIREIYLRRTRIREAALDEMLRHDLDLDAATCLRLGIVDRILDYARGGRAPTTRAAAAGVSTHLVLIKTNYNRFQSTCSTAADCAALDTLVAEGGAELKPVVYYPYRFCLDPGEVGPSVFSAFMFIPRMQALCLRTHCYSVLDTDIHIEDYLPSLFCSRRFMYETASVKIFLRTTRMHGQLMDDVVANTRLFMTRLRAVLEERTRIPADVLDAMSGSVFMFDAQECLRYGLCDEIVRV